MESKELILLTGSYCSASENGVRAYSFNQDTAAFSLLHELSGISNPSFLYPHGEFVYVVSEDDNTPSLYSLKYNSFQESLCHVDVQSTIHAAPCNIIVSPDGRYAYTSNYVGASITEFPLFPDGTLGKGRVINFQGSSVHPKRQRQPYIHAVNFSPDGRFLLVNDLGTDNIHVFPYNSKGINEDECQHFFVKAGTGPRHLCFSPNGKYAYLISELSGEVFVLLLAGGKLSLVQTLKVDDADASGSADVHISADGRFLYTSHRLQNDGISIMKISNDGTLLKVGYQPTGIHPRHFILTPNQRYLLVACRGSNMIQIFSRDTQTGLLEDTEITISSQRPVCVQFL